MSNEHDNRPLKRILAVLSVVEELYDKKKQETFTVTFADFAKMDDLLNDERAVEIACEKITSKNKPDFQVVVHKKSLTANELTASSGVYGVPVTKNVVEVEVHIGDKKLIERFRQTVKAELSLKESVPCFYFYIKAKQAFLGMEGSASSEISFKVKSERFKLILALHEKKKKMTINDLQQQLELTEDQLRNAIEGVRKRVAEAFDLELNAFLVYDEDSGYELMNLKEMNVE